jgi:hypothetical protein
MLRMMLIPEIRDASGAKLNASEGMLPGSTEVNKYTAFEAIVSI